jgi:enamine deaminase RidA (YjgF/YER057c/UK114 family)
MDLRGELAIGRRCLESTRFCVSAFISLIIPRERIAVVNIRHTPATVAAPFGPYSHAVEVPEGSRLLYISGEVGVLPDGTVPATIEAQAEACWGNIIAILADAGMGVADLVKITTYLVRPEDVAGAGAARAKHFGDARPGSATIIVKALVNPAWLIEIEAVAAARAR